ncbi:MAG TPA: DUF2865 domain-containing protein, partial [Burkholderiales bacterium]|nr:DUF2865 domain-containing protein [Burkholderiales bacterium]
MVQRRAPTPPPLAYANPAVDPWSFLSALPREGPARAGPTVTYCVRLCDGRYFPVQRKAANSSPAMICAAQCPASRTGVFTGSGIDNAVRANGARYANLEGAFLYRDRIVADCSCNGTDPYGLAAVDIHSDPTLQRGDIVVTDTGPVTFVGDQRLPHQAVEFVATKDSRHVSESLRKQLSTLRIARQLALELWLPDPLPPIAPES